MRLKNEDIIEIVKMIDEGIGLSSIAQNIIIMLKP